MTPELERDLAAWERGVLSREDLVAVHGDDVTAVLGLHDELIRGVAIAPIDADEAWRVFSSRLDQPAPVVRLPGRRLRTAVLAAAAALMLAGSAIAIVGPRIVDDPEPITPSLPVPTGGSLAGPSSSGRDDVGPFVADPEPSEGPSDETEPRSEEGPSDEPSDGSIGGTPAEDDQGAEPQNQGDVGGDDEGDNSQGDSSQGDESQGDSSQDSGSQGDQGQDANDQTGGDQGGNDQGSGVSDGSAPADDGQGDQD